MLQALGPIHLKNNCGENEIKEGDNELHNDVYMLQYWF